MGTRYEPSFRPRSPISRGSSFGNPYYAQRHASSSIMSYDSRNTNLHKESVIFYNNQFVNRESLGSARLNFTPAIVQGRTYQNLGNDYSRMATSKPFEPINGRVTLVTMGQINGMFDMFKKSKDPSTDDKDLERDFRHYLDNNARDPRGLLKDWDPPKSSISSAPSDAPPASAVSDSTDPADIDPDSETTSDSDSDSDSYSDSDPKRMDPINRGIDVEMIQRTMKEAKEVAKKAEEERRLVGEYDKNMEEAYEGDDENMPQKTKKEIEAMEKEQEKLEKELADEIGGKYDIDMKQMSKQDIKELEAAAEQARKAYNTEMKDADPNELEILKDTRNKLEEMVQVKKLQIEIERLKKQKQQLKDSIPKDVSDVVGEATNEPMNVSDVVGDNAYDSDTSSGSDDSDTTSDSDSDADMVPGDGGGDGVVSESSDNKTSAPPNPKPNPLMSPGIREFRNSTSRHKKPSPPPSPPPPPPPFAVLRTNSHMARRASNSGVTPPTAAQGSTNTGRRPSTSKANRTGRRPSNSAASGRRPSSASVSPSPQVGNRSLGGLSPQASMQRRLTTTRQNRATVAQRRASAMRVREQERAAHASPLIEEQVVKLRSLLVKPGRWAV